MSIGIWGIAGIVILVIFILILRSRSVETIKPPSGANLMRISINRVTLFPKAGQTHIKVFHIQ